MHLTIDQVRKVAKLASLPISDDETIKYANQLSKILDYIEKLNQVKTEKVEPTYNVTGLKSVMRPDQIGKSLSQNEALQNGANIKNSYFVTKGVFEEE